MPSKTKHYDQKECKLYSSPEKSTLELEPTLFEISAQKNNSWTSFPKKNFEVLRTVVPII